MLEISHILVSVVMYLEMLKRVYLIFDPLKITQTAYYKLKRHLHDMFYQNPKLSLKLFVSLVKPFLLNYRLLGMLGYCYSTKNSKETLNTSICKELLDVKKHTSNVACKLELGRYPLHIDAVKKCIKTGHVPTEEKPLISSS